MASNLPNIGADIAVAAKLSLLALLLGEEAQSVITEYVKTGQLELDVIPEWAANIISGPLAAAERTIGEPLFELLIRAPSGVALSGEAGAQEANAVQMVQRMMGFAFVLPWGVAQLKQLLQAGMGDNAPKAVIEALEKLPEDIGINWALGTVMANIFELSTGRPLAEAINQQARPFRFEWPQIRALLRNAHISKADAEDRFKKIGMRDEDMPLALQLDRTFLSLGDLQQAFLYGLLDEGAIRAYLDHLGLDPADVDVLVGLYLNHAQTTGAAELRRVAQQGFLEDHLSEAQYRAILTEANVPATSIDLEVEAAILLKGWGRLQLTITEIKSLHQSGQLDDAQARSRLLEHGYSEDDAQAIITSWKAAPRSGRLGLSEQRILGYELSGILTRNQAYARLLQNGMSADDAAFLADNPSQFGGVFRFPLTPPAILAALKSGDIDEAAARTLLASTGMAPTEIDLRIKVAEHTARRSRKPNTGVRTLSEAQVLEVLKLGLAAPSWALTELSSLGYSDADAAVLVAAEQTKAAGAVPDGWTTLT